MSNPASTIPRTQVRHIARRLDCKSATVRDLLRTGRLKLPELQVDNRPMFSTASLATYFEVHQSTIRDLLRTSRLPEPDLRIGRRLRWKPDTIAAVVARERI